MGSNGSRKPPRPRIVMAAGNPSEAESAAITAALERFLTETAPEPAQSRQSRWQQAALRDGVSRDPGLQSWGRQA